MLHNSLFRHDLLLKMNRHPLVLQRRQVHRNVGRRTEAKPAAGQIEMTGAWAIRTARALPAEKNVAADAEDFFKRMNVAIDPGAPKQLLLEIGSADAGFRCVVSDSRVEVHGTDAAALWAGWVHLENQILNAGEIKRRPAWDVQIAPPTWGANYAVPDLSSEFVGDDTFRSLAHAGADGMFIYGDFLLYADGTRLEELNHPDAAKNLKTLADATKRAANFGIKLYFVAVGPKLPADHAVFKRLPEVRGAQLQTAGLHCLCSSSGEALAFHADVFARMFKEAPELGGLILIIGGESYYHCFMRAAGSKIGETNCPQCAGKVAEDVIANFLDWSNGPATMKAGTVLGTVLAWPYSAQYFWSNEPNQLKLIDRLPESVDLLSEIDKDQVVIRGGHTKRIWDYSVDYDDHSDRIVSQALACEQHGCRLFIKTETSHGIELLHLPYVPAIGRSAKQWQSIRAIRPAGVLQRWGFIGMFDSVAERIGYLARWDPDFAPTAATMQVARQLFAGAAANVVEAWKHFDDSVHHIPVLTTGPYYCGPAFLGPCHPLAVWDEKAGVPDAFKGQLYYLLEAEATFSTAPTTAKHDLTISSTKQLGVFADPAAAEAMEAEFALARDAAARGHEVLKAIDAEKYPPHVREEIVEQQAIGEYLYRTYRATVNTIAFLRAKEAGKRESLPAIAQDELENTVAARTIYERAPWLNHNLRLDLGAPDSLAMIDEKTRLLQLFLKK